MRWLESYLSLQAEELDGLANRVALLLARLDTMPPQQEGAGDALTPREARLLKTEILLLQGSVFMRESNANAGNRVRYAPKHLLNLWAQYDIPVGYLEGLGFGLGMNHVSEDFTQSNNAYVLPAYTLVDAVVSYRFRQLQLQLNINNLLDKTHFTDAIFGNQFFPGKTRSFLLTLSYNSEI